MAAPTTLTRTPRTTTQPTRAMVPAKKAAPLQTPHMPGPRLFQVMRVGLVVWTLVSSVLCLASVLASQSHQESSAGALIHAQDIRDLRSEVSQAQAMALTSMLDPQGTAGTNLWDLYGESRTQVDLLLLGSAASASHPADLGDVANKLRIWQENLAVIHHDFTEQGTLAEDATTTISTDYTAVINAITTELNATASQESSSTPFIVLSILASVLGGLGFVVVLVVTARRSHRVINVGLSIGLLAIIAAIVAVGIYANHSGQISDTDSRIAVLSQAQTDTWDARSEDALSILEPDSSQTHLNAAKDLATLISSSLRPLTSIDVLSLVTDQSTIMATGDPAARSDLILNGSSWQTLSTALDITIDSARPDAANLVVPALGYVVTVATCCVIAIIATLAGIHARTKEYS